MSDTQTQSTGEQHSGGGKHRGQAAAEEAEVPAQGRHRRTEQDGE